MPRAGNLEPCFGCCTRKIKCLIIQDGPEGRLCLRCGKRGLQRCPAYIPSQERTRILLDAVSGRAPRNEIQEPRNAQDFLPVNIQQAHTNTAATIHPVPNDAPHAPVDVTRYNHYVPQAMIQPEVQGHMQAQSQMQFNAVDVPQGGAQNAQPQLAFHPGPQHAPHYRVPTDVNVPNYPQQHERGYGLFDTNLHEANIHAHLFKPPAPVRQFGEASFETWGNMAASTNGHNDPSSGFYEQEAPWPAYNADGQNEQ